MSRARGRGIPSGNRSAPVRIGTMPWTWTRKGGKGGGSAPRPGPKPAARRALPPLAEAVEPRLLFATFLVSNFNDAGPGSFRQAILNSNATAAEKDAIH